MAHALGAYAEQSDGDQEIDRARARAGRDERTQYGLFHQTVTTERFRDIRFLEMIDSSLTRN